MNDNWTNKSRSRRETLKSIAGVGGLMAGGAMISACGSNGGGQQAQAQPNMQNVDFNDPAQSLRAFVKATANLDPSIETPGWFGGTVSSFGLPFSSLHKAAGPQLRLAMRRTCSCIIRMTCSHWIAACAPLQKKPGTPSQTKPT